MSTLHHGVFRYERDRKILKILAYSNSKQFRVYDIFEKQQIDDDR